MNFSCKLKFRLFFISFIFISPLFQHNAVLTCIETYFSILCIIASRFLGNLCCQIQFSGIIQKYSKLSCFQLGLRNFFPKEYKLPTSLYIFHFTRIGPQLPSLVYSIKLLTVLFIMFFHKLYLGNVVLFPI